MSRREALAVELERLIAAVAEDPRCQRAILFGSLVTGEVRETSDIDLVIIQETGLPFWQRMCEMRRRLSPRMATDLLVYTPAEFEPLSKERSFFRDEVRAKGRVVHEWA